MWLCFCLFVFCLAPPPHSCQLDCLGVAVYLSIFGFSGCCCLDMIHESFSHTLQEMLSASCYGYSTSWLRETPCEIEIVRLISFVCMSLFHQCCSSWPIASFALQQLVNKPCIKLRMCCKDWGFKCKLGRSHFQWFQWFVEDLRTITVEVRWSI